MKNAFKSLRLMSLLAASVFSFVVPASLFPNAYTQAHAQAHDHSHHHGGSHAIQSKTKTVSGLRYKLTLPKPLVMGKQKWMLHVSGSEAAIQGLSFEAMVTMADGMKSKVKVTPKEKGVFELSTELSMGGEWELVLTKNKQAKESAKFELTVMGDSHAGHKM